MDFRTHSIDLYLNIMKKALSYSLWQEPGIPIEAFNYRRQNFKKLCVNTLASLFKKVGYQIVTRPNNSENMKRKGMLSWSTNAETMIGLKRLDNIQFCIEDILKNNVIGDLIETGVWRGGACIFMKAALTAYGITDRKIFVADSFEGLPKPDGKKFPQDIDDVLYKENYLAVTEKVVRANFEKYALLDSKVVFLKGWFNETLPKAPIEKLSILRLDGDLYQSTIEALTYLYPKLSNGGYCIIDDYCLSGCREAVEDFREMNNIKNPIKKIDWSGVFWRKE